MENAFDAHAVNGGTWTEVWIINVVSELDNRLEIHKRDVWLLEVLQAKIPTL